MEKEMQKKLLGPNLKQKFEQSKEIIRKALEKFSHDELCLAWTGGKDSTTMLWLYREVCQEMGAPLPRAMFIDEGHVFEEIMDLVKLGKGEMEG